MSVVQEENGSGIKSHCGTEGEIEKEISHRGFQSTQARK
jgi:hypothetical protein